jgi:DNA-binding NtrC family response regulator
MTTTHLPQSSIASPLPRPNPSTESVMVIDDDAEMRSMIVDFLKSEGYRVYDSRLASEALARIQRGDFDVSDEPQFDNRLDLVITDLNMPEMSGIEFTQRLQAIAPHVPTIVVTAFGSIETAIEAIRKGAFDYTTKPFKLSEMSVTVARALRFRSLHLDNARLQNEIQRTHSYANIIGKSPGMQEVFDLVRRVAFATANVLIMGESGTGKERVARAIHDEGPRRGKQFVAINCTAIPETLLESELFGHAKGAFTGAQGRKRGLFEEAEGGTLFLDEIGDMNLALQSKLLRVIQERKIRAVGETTDREVNVRIIAATHKDLKQSIKNASFREDLYYRLSVIPIVIPPLRHRREDIPLLAEHFLNKYAAQNFDQNGQKRHLHFSHDAISHLIAQSWEGNVRELENVIERAVVLATSDTISIADFPKSTTSTVENFFASSQSGALPTLEEVEKRYMKFILDKTGGRKEKAAQILGVNRRTLYRKERIYGFVDASVEPNGDERFDGIGEEDEDE